MTWYCCWVVGPDSPRDWSKYAKNPWYNLSSGLYTTAGRHHVAPPWAEPFCRIPSLRLPQASGCPSPCIRRDKSTWIHCLVLRPSPGQCIGSSNRCSRPDLRVVSCTCFAGRSATNTAPLHATRTQHRGRRRTAGPHRTVAARGFESLSAVASGEVHSIIRTVHTTSPRQVVRRRFMWCYLCTVDGLFVLARATRAARVPVRILVLTQRRSSCTAPPPTASES